MIPLATMTKGVAALWPLALRTAPYLIAAARAGHHIEVRDRRIHTHGGTVI